MTVISGDNAGAKNPSNATRHAANDAARAGRHVAGAVHDEFEALVADAEDLLKKTVDEAGSQGAAARLKLQAAIAKAKERIGAGADVLAAKGTRAAEATDDYVRASPWQALGMAAVVGLAIGVLLGRR